ncbi:hypothetical protein BZG36_04074 [Bifiguratus adelaidae]|uniref:Uncharacterized protein n=1 Tax=Bifiguratus adelaidae TaxID=1938954 RepID=A0A261XXU9_9FUNG|nr:hypothetical protein BZG36_04074 [Bifiguratus adelaidae]
MPLVHGEHISMGDLGSTPVDDDSVEVSAVFLVQWNRTACNAAKTSSGDAADKHISLNLVVSKWLSLQEKTSIRSPRRLVTTLTRRSTLVECSARSPPTFIPLAGHPGDDGIEAGGIPENKGKPKLLHYKLNKTPRDRTIQTPNSDARAHKIICEELPAYLL